MKAALAATVALAVVCGCRSLPEYRTGRGAPAAGADDNLVGVPPLGAPGRTKAPPKGGTPTGGSPTVRDDREAAAALRRQLQQPIPRVAWPNIPWPDAVEFLRGATELNIVAIDEALANEGIGPERKVTLDATDITAEDALNRLVALMGTGDVPQNRAVWFVRGNVVVITTQAKAGGRAVPALVVPVVPPPELIERVPADP